jgi:hypothetical protein
MLDGAVGRAGLRPDQRVGRGQGAGGEVKLGRADIEVAEDGVGRETVQPLRRQRPQPRHPAELVGVAFLAARIAVRQVDAGGVQPGGAHLDVAGLGVGLVAGEGFGDDLEGMRESTATPLRPPCWPIACTR